MNKTIALTCLTIMLSACGEQGAAEKAVRESLKDPTSAKFGKFTNPDPKYACLTVNAKNSWGGYTGDQQAMLVKDGDGWWVLSIREMSQAECLEYLKGAIK